MASFPRASDLKKRAENLAKELRTSGLEGVIIAPGPNLAYYTGVRAQLLKRPFLLLMEGDGDAHLLAPKLETGPFRGTIQLTVHAWDDTEGPSRAYGELIKEIETEGRWGCEGRVPFGFLEKLLSRGLKVKPADHVLESIREIKEPSELELIRKSAAILSKSVLDVPQVLREGMTERELARFVVESALASGADEVNPCTVQSGARAADPHSETTSKKIRRGESVVLDVVSNYQGYTADITRTFVLGAGGDVEKTYRSVLAAQERAIDSANAGVETGKVDAAARDSLKKDGLAKYFIHRTGHGLGLEVHEAPYIVAGGRERIRPGMVFTAEPGVYIAGKLGVRIEDDVAISKDGRGDVMTGTLPKDYGWWRR